MVRVAFTVFQLQLKSSLQYPFVLLTAWMNSVVFGLIRVVVLQALMMARPGFSADLFNQTLTYVILTEGFLSALNIWGVWDLAQSIRTGEIAVQLTRPASPVLGYLMRFLARSVVNLMCTGLPVVLTLMLVFHPTLPHVQGFAVMLTFGLAVLISALWMLFLNLLAFWVPDHHSYSDVSYYAALFASGMIVPLYFLPQGLQNVLHWTPFPYMLSKPIEVFAGVTTDPTGLVVTQLMMVVSFVLLNAGLLHLGLKKSLAVGG